MLTRLEEDDDGQAGRRLKRVEPPAIVRPDVLVVARRSAAAVDAALAVTRLLLLHRRSERSRTHLAVERPCIPGLDRGHAQPAGDARVELLWRLGHCRMLTSRAVEWPQSFYELRRGEGCEM